MKYVVVITRTSHQTKEFTVEVPDNVSEVDRPGHATMVAHEQAANTDFNNPGTAEYLTDSVRPFTNVT